MKMDYSWWKRVESFAPQKWDEWFVVCLEKEELTQHIIREFFSSPN